MTKGFKALKSVSDQVTRLDRTIENLNVRQEYLSPGSHYANSSSFTMARMVQSGLSTEDVAYAFVLPVEEVEKSVRFTQNYREEYPGHYKKLMGNTVPMVLPLSNESNSDRFRDQFSDDEDILISEF